MNTPAFARVSPELAAVVRCVRSASTWLTVRAVVERTGVASVTVRHHLLALSRAGLLERLEVCGGYRYRLAPTAVIEHPAELARIEEAEAVFAA